MTIPEAKSIYMTLGTWRHYEAQYDFTYRGRLAAKFQYICTHKDDDGAPRIPEPRARTFSESFDVWRRTQDFGRGACGTKDLRTRSEKLEFGPY